MLTDNTQTFKMEVVTSVNHAMESLIGNELLLTISGSLVDLLNDNYTILCDSNFANQQHVLPVIKSLVQKIEEKDQVGIKTYITQLADLYYKPNEILKSVFGTNPNQELFDLMVNNNSYYGTIDFATTSRKYNTLKANDRGDLERTLVSEGYFINGKKSDHPNAQADMIYQLNYKKIAEELGFVYNDPNGRY